MRKVMKFGKTKTGIVMGSPSTKQKQKEKRETDQNFWEPWIKNKKQRESPYLKVATGKKKQEENA